MSKRRVYDLAQEEYREIVLPQHCKTSHVKGDDDLELRCPSCSAAIPFGRFGRYYVRDVADECAWSLCGLVYADRFEVWLGGPDGHPNNCKSCAKALARSRA